MAHKTMLDRIRSWISSNSEHITVKFFADPDGRPLTAGDGYLRLWLVEGFLAQQVTWGKEYFPALHGGVTLTFLGSEDTPFTRFTKQGNSLTAPGAYLNYPMTSLLPFSGGTVEVEAALFRVSSGGPLETAVTIAGELASLIGPPLSVAAAVAEKVSTGINSVLEAQDTDPVLGVHWAMTSDGAGGEVLRPGFLAVINGSPGEVPETLEIIDGRLHGSGGLLTGFDFLLLRVECRTERDDWRFPKLEQLRKEAVAAYHFGRMETFEDLKRQAIVEVGTSADLTEADRYRVAKYVRTTFDRVAELGIVADEEVFDPIAGHLLPDRYEVEGLTMSELLRA
jgi:hypothetical protein